MSAVPAWVFGDLRDDELHAYTTLICLCSPPSVTGTRNGFRCSKHRAQDEIERRLLAAHRAAAPPSPEQEQQP